MHNECPSVDLNHEIDVIVARLEEEFREIEPAIVAEVVHRCAAHFDDAPIQTFVPLLAEKRAREWLRACSSERRQSLLTTDEGSEWIADLAQTVPYVVDRPAVRAEVSVV